MQRKHNKDIVPTAKMLRKNMTKEEKHLWYDFFAHLSRPFFTSKGSLKVYCRFLLRRGKAYHRA